MSIETATILETGQPYPYRQTELVEPDWTRFPKWQDVTREQWESVQWQRANCIKNLKQLRGLYGDLIDERFYADMDRDQRERATMSKPTSPRSGTRRSFVVGATTASPHFRTPSDLLRRCPTVDSPSSKAATSSSCRTARHTRR